MKRTHRPTPSLVFSIFLLGFSVMLWGCSQSDTALTVDAQAVGLRASYYDNEDFTGTKVSRIDTTMNFEWGAGSPAPGIAPDSFSVRWTGSIAPRYSDLYTFTASADDGLRVWVNGVRIIDSWAYSPYPRYGKLRLEANKRYTIRIDYHEGVVGAGFRLYWQSKLQTREIISTLSTDPGVSEGLSEALPLKDLAYARGIVIGGALEPNPMLANETLYLETAKREFSFMSPDGSFSIIDTHSDVAPYPMLDTLPRLGTQVNFARQNGAQVQAFHLAWYRDSLWTSYLNRIPSAQRWAFLEQHIRDLMTRYKGKARYYNVVNEAFDEYGKLRGRYIDQDPTTGTYAGINWLYPLGKSYLEKTFRLAHEVDPTARLVYNDYELEYNDEGSTTSAKWEAVLAMVKDFKARGVPIHTVGFQGHHTLGYRLPDPALLAERFRILKSLGVEVRITEFDINIDTVGSLEGVPLQERLALQAQYYKAYLDVCLAAPNCTGFQSWGFTDKYTWYADPNNPYASPEARPLMFDTLYRPKPAYYALRDALLGR
jgi:endo-1,4-beta-xylanase